MIAYIVPELILSISLLIILVVGVFLEKVYAKTDANFKKTAKIINDLTILVLLVVSYFSLNLYFDVYKEASKTVVVFGGLFSYDSFTFLVKLSAIIFTILILVIYGERVIVNSVNTSVIARFEFPILVSFALLGANILISANNFMMFYLGVELMALSSYILTAFKRDDVKSSEAGLKYFILGALSSGLLLFGISYIYGFLGTLNFGEIKAQTSLININQNLGLLFGIVMVLIALFFKISAAPFHMWVPDVYEGAAKIVLLFFATTLKFIALFAVFRLLNYPFSFLLVSWQQIIIFVAVASMVVGAFGAIKQKNIKRLIAYSGIKHVGFVLLGLIFVSADAKIAVINYIYIYSITSLGLIISIIYMRKNDVALDEIADLSGLSKTHPLLAFCIAVLIFSMAGIPPMAGFFAKFYILKVLVTNGYYTVAIISVILATVSAFYYLKIVKVMYFDSPKIEFDKFFGFITKIILFITVAFNLFFFLAPSLFNNLDFVLNVSAFL